jgi:endoglucanase
MFMKLPILLSFMLLTTNIFASEIVEILPINKNIILIHFDDGYVQHHTLGQQRTDEIVFDNPLNVTSATQILSYGITSADDVFYNTLKRPDSIGRKTKPTEFVTCCNILAKDYVFEHWVFLYLPNAMISGKTYVINTGNLATNGTNFNFTFNENINHSEAIHVNNVSYSTTSTAKYGYLYYWAGDKGSIDFNIFLGQPFYLKKASDNTIVFSGTVAFRGDKDVVESLQTDAFPNANFAFADMWDCNFSSFSIAGEYKLVIPGIGSSYPFSIKYNGYNEPFKAVCKGLYNQRSGVALTTPYTNKPRPAPHNPLVTPGFNNQLIYTTWRAYDGTDIDATKDDVNAIEAGFKGPLNNLFGWYQDAGDWDAYLTHARVPMTLLWTYEMTPNNFVDNELNIPESGNGIPDILDEARWLVRFYYRTRKAIKDAGYGTGGVGGARICGDFFGDDTKPDGTTKASWTDVDRKWIVSGEDVWMTYKYAGLAAHLAFIYKKNCFTDPEDINWENEAKEAYAWAKAKQTAADEVPKFNETYVLKNDRTYAAAMLYKLTGLINYNNDFVTDVNGLPNDLNLSYPNPEKKWGILTYASLPDTLITNTELKAACRGSILLTADFILLYYNERNARWKGNMYQPFQNGHATTPLVFEGIMGYYLTKKSDPIKAAQYKKVLYSTADYFLGTNPLNMTWISGVGERNPQSGVFKLDDWYSSSNAPLIGVVPYGPRRLYKNLNGNTGYEPDYPTNKVYPTNIEDWPKHETWFEQRYAPGTCEYTIHENMCNAIAAYGILGDSVTPDIICSIGVLPIKEIKLTSAIVNGNGKINWEIIGNYTSGKSTLQKSNDGIVYKDIYEINSIFPNKNFEYYDRNLVDKSYYRIKFLEPNSNIAYSNVVKLFSKVIVIQIYPNPAKTFVEFSLNKTLALNEELIITDIQGKLVKKCKPIAYQKIDVTNFKSGTYFIRLIENGGKQNQVQKFMIIK